MQRKRFENRIANQNGMIFLSLSVASSLFSSPPPLIVTRYTAAIAGSMIRALCTVT